MSVLIMGGLLFLGFLLSPLTSGNFHIAYLSSIWNRPSAVYVYMYVYGAPPCTYALCYLVAHGL